VARIFFAVGVSRELTRSLHALGSEMRARIPTDALRFTDPEQAHFTLRFLGEQEPDRVTAAVRAGRAVQGVAPFGVELSSLGVFPNERRPHTLWVGAGQGATELVALAQKLEGELAREGFIAEERPFVPHLTLARVKGRLSSRDLGALLAERHPSLGAAQVESFMLMESKSHGGGVRYTALETFLLEIPCTPSRSPSTAAPKS
jgi:2'-5' RNA ligase